jgi:pectin methylesterase-like acyl-CoA thioesterase
MAELELPIYIGCDNTFEINDFRIAHTPTSFVNSGTATWILYDADGVAVTSGSGNMSYTTSSDGDWYGTVTAAVTATLTENAKYKIKISATDGTYTIVAWIKCRAEYYYGE